MQRWKNLKSLYITRMATEILVPMHKNKLKMQEIRKAALSIPISHLVTKLSFLLAGYWY